MAIIRCIKRDVSMQCRTGCVVISRRSYWAILELMFCCFLFPCLFEHQSLFVPGPNIACFHGLHGNNQQSYDKGQEREPEYVREWHYLKWQVGALYIHFPGTSGKYEFAGTLEPCFHPLGTFLKHTENWLSIVVFSFKEI